MKHDSKDPRRAVLGSEVWAPGPGSLTRGVGARSSGIATAKLAQLLPEPACVMGATNDCRPPREPKRRHPVRSRQLALWVLVKPLREVRETPFLPVPSSVPFQFCDPSWRLLLSFSPLGALKFHQVDAGEQAPGRSSASRQSRQLFWPAHPALLGWRAHLLPWFAVQMETQRWPRAAGQDGGSDSRAPG